MDRNYKRKRTIQRLRQRLSELYKARTELDSTRTSSQRNCDFWTVLAEKEAIDSQIEDIERKLFVRRD
ncbi:MAG: hypothetical protein P4L59_14245 [Desulfosporosinus sp.]|nr:hypothetical protein [Desulfosporosinus sp.]